MTDWTPIGPAIPTPRIGHGGTPHTRGIHDRPDGKSRVLCLCTFGQDHYGTVIFVPGGRDDDD